MVRSGRRQALLDRPETFERALQGQMLRRRPVFGTQSITVRIEIALHGRIQLAGDVEKCAQKEAAFGFLGARRDVAQAMALGQSKADGRGLVEHRPLRVASAGTRPAGLIARKAAAVFLPQRVDRAQRAGNVTFGSTISTRIPRVKVPP